MSPARAPISLHLPEPSAAALAAVRAWLLAVEMRAALLSPRCAYLVLTPLCAGARTWLEGELRRRSIRVISREVLSPWARITTALRVRLQNAPDLRRAAQYEAIWTAVAGDATAEAWGLHQGAHRHLAAHKYELRAQLGNATVAFGPRRRDRAQLHAFHLADPAAALDEARRLQAALALARGASAR